MPTTDKPLMFDAMLREHYERRLDLLRRALTGVATNATQCGACRMLNEIATEALERDVSLSRISGG